MRNKIWISFLAVMMPLLGYSQVDDMYFVPKKETKKDKKQSDKPFFVERAEAEEKQQRQYVPEEYSQATERDVDEYNRRYRNDGLHMIEDESDGAGEDSTYLERDVDEASEDYRYSKRILRFNTPTIGVAVSSPLYWDLRYGPNSIYWDVYDDGFYAYAYPSVWNSWYWGPSYSFSWGWGVRNPYWGWGGPWYAGWYDPWYYRPYWHHHHHWGAPGHNHPTRPVTRPSTSYRENSSLARGNSRRSNRTTEAGRASGRNVGRTPRSSSTTVREPRRTTQIPNTSADRPSRNPVTPRTGAVQPRNSQPSQRSTNYSPSTSRGSYTPLFGSPGRSGGGSVAPSRGSATPRGRR